MQIVNDIIELVVMVTLSMSVGWLIGTVAEDTTVWWLERRERKQQAKRDKEEGKR